ncbi:Hypothetical_protein [Hexamita inflata]|uniref:Hypothetical_protein n=1 Tax=Hexamita inflata TaxID=28002 RepID=A0AA86UPP1_9EUKA|nr:Hypothetical protein HINF_LOCUS47432 [Hexamita inflata]
MLSSITAAESVAAGSFTIVLDRSQPERVPVNVSFCSEDLNETAPLRMQELWLQMFTLQDAMVCDILVSTPLNCRSKTACWEVLALFWHRSWVAASPLQDTAIWQDLLVSQEISVDSRTKPCWVVMQAWKVSSCSVLHSLNWLSSLNTSGVTARVPCFFKPSYTKFEYGWKQVICRDANMIIIMKWSEVGEYSNLYALGSIKLILQQFRQFHYTIYYYYFVMFSSLVIFKSFYYSAT